MRLLLFLGVSLLVHAVLLWTGGPGSSPADAPQVRVQQGVSALSLRLVVPPQVTVENRSEPEPLPDRVEPEIAAVEEQRPVSAEDAPAAASGDEGVISEAAMTGQGLPEYPRLSQRRGEQGTVVLIVTVSDTGKCLEAEIESSSGYARLDNAARTWALAAAYNPGLRDGQPAVSQLRLKVPFILRRKESR